MRWIVAVEQLYQLLGVLGAVSVSDANALIIRLTHHLVILLRQRLDGVHSAAGLFKADDLALGVTFKNRLYVQNGRDRGLDARKPSSPTQVFKIIDREYLAHIMAQLIYLCRVFLDAHAAAAVLRRLDDQQPLAERGAERIYAELYEPLIPDDMPINSTSFPSFRNGVIASIYVCGVTCEVTTFAPPRIAA